MAMSAEYLARVSSAYCALLSAPDTRQAWFEIRDSLDPWPRSLLDELSGSASPEFVDAVDRIASQVAELIVVHFAAGGVDTRGDMDRLLARVQQLALTPGPCSRIATALMTVVIVGLEALPAELTQRVLDCLTELVGTEIGVPSRLQFPKSTSTAAEPALRNLLHAAIFAEVRRFCTARTARSIDPAFEEIVSRIAAPVVSVGSRKGGTGKSLLLAAVLAWFKTRFPTCKACILDLDLSGPIWQYVLFPNRNSPEHFLDDEGFIDLRQSVLDFRFPVPTEAAIGALVAEGGCPFGIEGTVGHLGVRDIPGVNHLLLLAAELSQQRFYPFIAGVIESLSRLYDLVLVDNSPGFDSIPHCTYSIATTAAKGLALVVSTPALADLRGTFLELANLRLIKSKRPPYWIVNKVTAASREFLFGKHSAYHMAKSLQAYDGVLPSTPLLERLLSAEAPVDFWQSISMDSAFLDFTFMEGAGMPKMTPLCRTGLAADVAGLCDKVLRPLCQ